MTSLPVAFIQSSLSCHLFSTDNEAAAFAMSRTQRGLLWQDCGVISNFAFSMGSWRGQKRNCRCYQCPILTLNTNAYFGHPAAVIIESIPLQTATHNHFNVRCLSISFLTLTLSCNTHVHTHRNAHVTADAVKPLSVSGNCHLQTIPLLAKNCYVNHKITFSSNSLQLLGNSILLGPLSTDK